jgi:ubiquinone/menaquinone biosynthesis C-methylase UbiE
VKEKYDRIGKNYNQTRKADPYLAKRLFHHLKPESNGPYLDIGCGTGNYTNALNKMGIDFIGVEPSTGMLEKARDKNKQIDWREGKAENIPLEDDTVDGCLATLTTHHWNDLEKAFLEINRVLKPKGRIVIFTSNPELMKGYWLNHYFPKILAASISQMPSFETTEKALEKGNFKIIETEKYFVREDLEDLFLYSGKHTPKIYLQQHFRIGISSFTDLANASEVEDGLEKLKEDIETGKVKSVIKNYENDHGDYLFIVASQNRER